MLRAGQCQHLRVKCQAAVLDGVRLESGIDVVAVSPARSCPASIVWLSQRSYQSGQLSAGETLGPQ